MRSIDSKMGVLRMINTLNANTNVVVLWIKLHSDYILNSEILTLIIDRYTNVFSIVVADDSC